jgi:hypothetical protein
MPKNTQREQIQTKSKYTWLHTAHCQKQARFRASSYTSFATQKREKERKRRSSDTQVQPGTTHGDTSRPDMMGSLLHRLHDRDRVRVEPREHSRLVGE